VRAYVEVHIEQGPVLEGLGLPVGVVSAIAGQTRLAVSVSGEQGHAGTVPMNLRRDALAGAAEAMVLMEQRCRGAAWHVPPAEERG
jgi:allantoate deiminase